MVLLEVREVVDFGGYVYVPLGKTPGVEVVGFMGDVKTGFSAFGVKFESG